MKLHATFLFVFLTVSWSFSPLFAADPIPVSKMQPELNDPPTPDKVKIVAQKAHESEKPVITDSAAKTGEKEQQDSQINRSTGPNKPATTKGNLTKYPEDRPWIIKRKTLKDTKPLKIKPPAFSWMDQAQKNKCGTYLGQVTEEFLHARYYSIQGDPCASADHAAKFMTLVDRCEQECPDDFLQKSGYNQRIVRNLRLINELGTRQCLGRMELDRDKPATPAKVGPSKPASPKTILRKDNAAEPLNNPE